MSTCSYCKKEGHHITKCRNVRCLTCKKVGHHHSKCRTVLIPKNLTRCNYCGKPGHNILQCLRQQYQQYVKEDNLIDFYTFIMTWKERRLLWIEDKKSMFGLLPLDIIRKIDDMILDYPPFYDLIEMSKTIKADKHQSGYRCKLTLISESYMIIPKYLVGEAIFLYTVNEDYLFVISGHIKFTPKQLLVLNKYGLKYQHILNYPRGN